MNDVLSMIVDRSAEPRRTTGIAGPGARCEKGVQAAAADLGKPGPVGSRYDSQSITRRSDAGDSTSRSIVLRT